MCSSGGHGGCTCDCNPETMLRHDPPLVFNIDDDMYEQHVLTPTTFPDFQQLVDAAKSELAKHYATLLPNVTDEMHSLPDPLLQPCCHGIFPFDCDCDDYVPHKVYP